MITHVITEKNNVDDSTILEDNFEAIVGEDTEELIADGAYANKSVQDRLSESKKTLITTAIRGRKPDSNKVRSTDFEIENNRIIRCPYGEIPIHQEYNNGVIIAHYAHESCSSCPLKCMIRKNKRKPHVLVITQERLQMDRQREKYNDSEYLKKCALRPAIEGTMFQFKLHLRNGKSRYRGKSKVKCSSILRTIAINFKRVYAYRLKEALSYFILRNSMIIKSFLARKNILCCFST